MNDFKYKDDLKDIKDIMNRSSRFISLSGLSGVAAGIIALIGAYLAYQTVYSNLVYLGYKSAILTNQSVTTILIIAVITIVLTIGAGMFFTSRKAKKNKEKLWDIQTKRLLINLLIPLATGGILSLMVLFKGYIGIVAPLTLIFYGLALVNASKYTLTEIRSLGLIEIILGLIAFQFIGYGLLFWSVGFGLLHILYGIAMHIKYK
jgi:predicted lysophospholipase L1 biosynthesis ABC-type transport system permease subunit